MRDRGELKDEKRAAADWRDGFLVVGNELALDFLNTRPVIDGEAVELLTDGSSVLRWMAAVGAMGTEEAARLEESWPKRAAAEVEELREFRERWRRAISEKEHGRPLDAAF